MSVWAQIRADENGGMQITIHARTQSRWIDKDGKVHVDPIHAGREISDALPPELHSQLVKAFAALLKAGKDSIMDIANRDAMTHASAMSNRPPPNTVQLKFEGNLKGEGSNVT